MWTRLDCPGQDDCRLYRLSDGWRLAGTAVFFEQRAGSLRYEVVTSRDWITRRALVDGHVGGRSVSVRIQASRSRRWRMNGVPQPRIDGYMDLDLAFTPATYLIAMKRLALTVGDGADATAAYLTFPALALVVLPQRYVRASALEYDYTSPTSGYAGRLRLTRDGWIDRYPGVFERTGAPKADNPRSVR